MENLAYRHERQEADTPLTIPFLAEMNPHRGPEIAVAEQDREGGVQAAGAPSIALRFDEAEPAPRQPAV